MADDEVEFSGAGSSGDGITEVSERGLLGRLWDSIGTALLGIVFFLASFVVLYQNEGTVNEATLAKEAVVVDANAPAGAAVGKFVAATGNLGTRAMLGDEYLAPGNYVKLSRKAEMFAWTEKTETKTEKKTGGGETKRTVYTYAKEWTGSPVSGDGFKQREGHSNPPMRVESRSQSADQASVGALALDMAAVSLPGTSRLDLGTQKTQGGTIWGEYLYVGAARADTPQVGDVRLSYEALSPGGTYTVLGHLASAGAVAPQKLEDRTMYRVFAGTKEDALGTLQTEYTLWVWGFRLLGFLLCWGGLRMMVSPLNTLLDVLPFLGDMGRGLTGFITFPIALVLSCLTIVVAWITHNLAAMVAIGIVTLLVAIRFFGARKAPKVTAGGAA